MLDGPLGRRWLRDGRYTIPLCIILICCCFAAAALLQMRLDRSHALSQAAAVARQRAEIAARAALDHIGRDGPRRPGEPDQRRPVRQPAAHAPHGLVNRVERRDTGPTLECIKASRTRRPDPLAIVRAVRTDPTNEASWLEATMTLGADTAAAGALSNLDLAVLGVLCKAINPPSSTDVRLLVRKAGGKGNNEEINASVAGLRAADLIQWKSVGKAKAWSPTDAGRAAYARARGEGGNAE